MYDAVLLFATAFDAYVTYAQDVSGTTSVSCEGDEAWQDGEGLMNVLSMVGNRILTAMAGNCVIGLVGNRVIGMVGTDKQVLLKWLQWLSNTGVYRLIIDYIISA